MAQPLAEDPQPPHRLIAPQAKNPVQTLGAGGRQTPPSRSAERTRVGVVRGVGGHRPSRGTGFPSSRSGHEPAEGFPVLAEESRFAMPSPGSRRQRRRRSSSRGGCPGRRRSTGRPRGRPSARAASWRGAAVLDLEAERTAPFQERDSRLGADEFQDLARKRVQGDGRQSRSPGPLGPVAQGHVLGGDDHAARLEVRLVRPTRAVSRSARFSIAVRVRRAAPARSSRGDSTGRCWSYLRAGPRSAISLSRVLGLLEDTRPGRQVSSRSHPVMLTGGKRRVPG